MLKRRRKQAQEEIVGFAIIIILVAVILLFFLVVYLNKEKSETLKNYEVESFIQSTLQYTTDCDTDFGLRDIKGLIKDCDKGKKCLDDRYSCEVLSTTLTEITENSWNTEEDSPLKGYKLSVISDSETLFEKESGNSTNNYIGSKQTFYDRNSDYNITLIVYY